MAECEVTFARPNTPSHGPNDYRANEQDSVIESTQDHVGDEHGDVPTREEVEEYVTGPG